MTFPRSRVELVAVGALLFAIGCGSDCVVQNTEYTTSVSTVGYVGPTQGKPVARFDLKQNYISHTPYEACAQGPLQDVGIVEMSVTNISGLTLSIEYDVQGLNASGNMVWDFPSKIARIAPNETVAVGQVGVSPVPVNLGAKVVLTAVTVVP